MKNLINKTKLAFAFFVIISLVTLNLPQVNKPAKADVIQPTYEQTASVEAKSLDTRAVILQQYLADKGSPMQNNAQDFIDAADKYGVDWKLVPSIAGVESTYGLHVPGGTDPSNSSFNAYGWGVYGTNAIYFGSWKDGIYTLNQGLKEKYISKGLTNPYTINKVYAASPTWGVRVASNIADLGQYEQKFNKQLANSRLGNVLNLVSATPKPSTAPLPAAIAFK